MIRSINPSNTKATFVQSTGYKYSYKPSKPCHVWHSLDSSRRALSDEYPCARVSVIFNFFASFCIGQSRWNLCQMPCNIHLTRLNQIKSNQIDSSKRVRDVTIVCCFHWFMVGISIPLFYSYACCHI